MKLYVPLIDYLLLKIIVYVIIYVYLYCEIINDNAEMLIAMKKIPTPLPVKLPVKLLAMLLITMVLSCSENNDEKDDVAIRLNLNLNDVKNPVADINLYCFDDLGRVVVEKKYESAAELDNDEFILDNKPYTFIAMINADENIPEVISAAKTRIDKNQPLIFSNFVTSVKNNLAHDKDVMSGTVVLLPSNQANVDADIPISYGIEGVKSNTLELNVTKNNTTRSNESSNSNSNSSRIVVEIREIKSDILVHTYSTILTQDNLVLYLQKGEYKILLWADYGLSATKSDLHYVTNKLSKVCLNENFHTKYLPYRLDRSAFYAAFNIKIDKEQTKHDVVLQEPFSMYRIIATDLEKYKTFVEINNYPPYERLRAVVVYEGYFPCAFNLGTGNTSDAVLGLKYDADVSVLNANDVLLGEDYVFSGNETSTVRATVVISDTSSGKIVAQVPNVEITCNRGVATTIKGEFLTAGVGGGGIVIDTDWGGDFDVEF